VSDATLQVLRDAVVSAPFTYTVPGEQLLGLVAVRASFDGSGAAGAFLPSVQIKSAAGAVMVHAEGTSVAAGASADASFFPGVKAAATTGGSGLQFDTYPQSGTWFYADVTGSGGPDGWGFEVIDVNDNGTVFKGVPFLAGDVDQTSNGAWFYLRSSGFQLGITNNQHYRLTTGVGHIFDGFVNFAGPQLGFFGVTPVVRQATPVTLGDVIALLQAYGLAT